MKMQCSSFGNDVNFSSSRVLKSDRVTDFYCQRFTDIVLMLGRAYQWENCLTTTNIGSFVVGPTKL